MLPTHRNTFSPSVWRSDEVPPHLTEEEVNRLVRAYQKWFDANPNPNRARHWAIFLLMRYTGCRISEALSVDDSRDLDLRRCEVVLPTLKRHGRNREKMKRTVPLPANVVAEFGRLLATWPELRGNLFSFHRSTVFQVFRARAEEAGIPGGLRHPHVLRHTRAIELLRAGVPISAVQQVLGHADIATTAVYLRFSGVEIRRIMQDRGLL